MADPAKVLDQNLLPVQAYFAVDGTFQTFIGQGQPFFATLNPNQSGLAITLSTLDSSPIGSVTPSTGVFTNISTTTGSISTTPTANTDIANKYYVDQIAQGLSPKQAVKCGTTANITLSGLQTIDGYTTLAGDRVLVKNQSTSSQNGIYIASAIAWTRSADMDVWSEVPGAYTVILNGTNNANTGWVCTATDAGTINVTAMPWVQFSGTGTYFAGTGLNLASNTFSIANTGVTAASVGSASKTLTATVNAQGQLTSLLDTNIAIAATQITSGTIDTARISGSYTGITGVGTLTAGTWNASTIGVAYGGTGATTLTGYVKASGTSAFTAVSTIPNTDISGLGTMSTQNASSVAITGGSAAVSTLKTLGLTGYLYGNDTSVVTASTTIPTSALSGNFVSTFSAGSTGLTPNSATSGAVTLAGTLAVANGGTGVTSSSGANSVVLRDANANITVNCLFEGYATVAASGTTIVLTAASAQNYQITGSGGQVIRLPNATTLPNGALFTFNNNQSSGTITVQNNSSTTVATINSGGYVIVTLIDNAIAAGSWDRHDQTPSNVSWSTNTLDYPGSITSATWNGSTIAINRGGTNGTATPTAGAVAYGTGTAYGFTAAGSSGQVLQSNGSSAPTWATPSASITVTDDTSTAATRYPLFANQTAGNLTTEYVSSTKLQYNPSTGVFTATGFSGSGANLTSLTAGNLSGTIPSGVLGNSTVYIGTTAIALNRASGSISLTGTNIDGSAGSATTATTATNATKIAITDNTSSSSTYYPAMSVASSGNNPATTSSTKLSFIPSTGVLNATGFAGAGTGLTGTASSLSIGGNAANVTGTVAIANGGTGQTTATAGFNALSPITTTGDLILGNGTNSATRLAIGTNGYVLTSNGTTASWQASSGGGGITWQTVQTANFTAVSGSGYPVNTTSASITVTLPASPTAGNFVYFLDYAGKFATNNLLINPNGKNFNGKGYTSYINTNRESIGIVYIDATQGWIPFDGFNTSTPTQIVQVDYLVVGGGGGGGVNEGGGGGAGGFRTGTSFSLIAGTTYTITVGGGGAGGVGAYANGVVGSNSVFSTITSNGGGYGAGGNLVGGSGGSGGGGGFSQAGGSGNTPSTSPSQGNNGGAGQLTGAGNARGGGGGGASAVGGTATSSVAGDGGAGTASSITGSSVTYAGGGGGGQIGTASGGAGGVGGGGAGGRTGSGTPNGIAGTANTGGGGGGEGTAGAGGSGVVILSIPTSAYSATYTGSPTITTSGSNTILTFTGSGSYTA